MKKQKEKVYVTTRDLLIPAGTELPYWGPSEAYEAVLTLARNSVAYLRIEEEDIKYSEGLLVPKAPTMPKGDKR